MEERRLGPVVELGTWNTFGMPLAAKLGIAVTVMRPLGEGALVRRSVPEDALAQLGVESWAQALLTWALSDGRVDAVIPATRNSEHVRENAQWANRPGSTRSSVVL